MTKKKWKKMDFQERVKYLILEIEYGLLPATEIAQAEGFPDKLLSYLSKYECSNCGNESFTAHQQCYHDVRVDGHGQFEADEGIYESDSPYGPFTCTECDTEYEELPVAV